jgi:hypothetical protein
MLLRDLAHPGMIKARAVGEPRRAGRAWHPPKRLAEAQGML